MPLSSFILRSTKLTVKVILNYKSTEYRVEFVCARSFENRIMKSCHLEYPINGIMDKIKERIDVH